MHSHRSHPATTKHQGVAPGNRHDLHRGLRFIPTSNSTRVNAPIHAANHRAHLQHGGLPQMPPPDDAKNASHRIPTNPNAPIHNTPRPTPDTNASTATANTIGQPLRQQPLTWERSRRLTTGLVAHTRRPALTQPTMRRRFHAYVPPVRDPAPILSPRASAHPNRAPPQKCFPAQPSKCPRRASQRTAAAGPRACRDALCNASAHNVASRRPSFSIGNRGGLPVSGMRLASEEQRAPPAQPADPPNLA